MDTNNNSKKIPTFTSIRRCTEMLHEANKDCSITECMIRKMIRDGLIPTRRVGSKYVVTYETVVDYFSHPEILTESGKE